MRINSGMTGNARFVYRSEDNPLQTKTLAWNRQTSLTHDALSLSGIGGRLSIKGQPVAPWDDAVTNASDEEALRLIDESISAVGKILEDMKKAAEIGEDETLTDLDRIELQIEMSRLQERLSVETRRMSMRMAGQTEEEIAKNLSQFNDTAKNQIELLNRARDRILNGDAWDVRESYELNLVPKETIVISPEGRETFPAVEGEQGKEFVLPDYYNPQDVVILKNHDWNGGQMVVTDDEKVPSLREILESQNALILMDADSAAEAVGKIEAQLQDLAKMREQFASVVAERRAELQAESAGMAEPLMSEGEIDAMLGAVAQERAARERQAEENAKAAEDQAAGAMTSGSAKVDEYIDEEGNYRKQLLIGTDAGTMAYQVDETTGKPDMSSPRMIEAKNGIGAIFMKMEKLFKDKIGSLLGFASMSGTNRTLKAESATSVFASNLNTVLSPLSATTRTIETVSVSAPAS